MTTQVDQHGSYSCFADGLLGRRPAQPPRPTPTLRRFDEMTQSVAASALATKLRTVGLQVAPECQLSADTIEAILELVMKDPAAEAAMQQQPGGTPAQFSDRRTSGLGGAVAKAKAYAARRNRDSARRAEA